MSKDNKSNSDSTLLRNTASSNISTKQEIQIDNNNRQPRFSIIQSPLAAKGTYRLDSYTGDVYQMLLTTGGNETWQKLIRQSHTTADTQVDNYQNYILFLSPLAMRFTYLINVNTGATWKLVQDPQSEENFFSPIY